MTYLWEKQHDFRDKYGIRQKRWALSEWRKEMQNYGKNSIENWWYDVWYVRSTYERADPQEYKVKKVTSSAKDGETVIFSDAELDIPWAKKQIKDIGYEMVDYISEPYEKKGLFHFGRK